MDKYSYVVVCLSAHQIAVNMCVVIIKHGHAISQARILAFVYNSTHVTHIPWLTGFAFNAGLGMSVAKTYKSPSFKVLGYSAYRDVNVCQTSW